MKTRFTFPTQWLSVILAATLVAVTSAGAAAQESPLADEEKRIDLATDRGLDSLARIQEADGSWPSGYGKDTAITSLAVMAFLAKGHVPGEGPYGERVSKGVEFVLAQAQNNGLLAAPRAVSQGPMYSHGISTLMLAEVSGMCDDALAAKVRPVLQNAVKLTLAAQKVKRQQAAQQGGWRYQPSSNDSDISCSGWQLMSLRAAKNGGADVPASAIEEAVGYVKRSTCDRGGFAYQPGGGPNRSRTGTGILSLEICGRHHEPEALAGADYLLQNPPKWNDEFFYYGAYYCAQAMFQVGGRYWEVEQPRLESLLLSLQGPDGSWPVGRSSEERAGAAYSTSMAVLALSVKYHYLPIYQR